MYTFTQFNNFVVENLGATLDHGFRFAPGLSGTISLGLRCLSQLSPSVVLLYSERIVRHLLAYTDMHCEGKFSPVSSSSMDANSAPSAARLTASSCSSPARGSFGLLPGETGYSESGHSSRSAW